jgi:hypothetical protein
MNKVSDIPNSVTDENRAPFGALFSQEGANMKPIPDRARQVALILIAGVTLE